jgi:putative SOS response-associated peptidase YedK
MCGRYALDPRKLDRLVRLLSLPQIELPIHYNITPGQDVPVIRNTTGKAEWAMMRWGLVPHWAKEAKTAYSTFNARVETAAQKPAFRESWKHRRCIIPATGFYEWLTLESGKKQPRYFDSGDGQALALAGLWDHWTDGSETLDSCTILVGPPGPAVTGIHDRSPVMLGDAAISLWISPLLKATDIHRVVEMPHTGLEAQRVSRVADDGLHLNL